MKILRIIYDWPRPWNGLAPHPYEITRAQLKLGHEVELFTGLWPKSGGPEKLPGVKINALWREPFPGTVGLTTSVLLFFRYLFWRKGNEVDIVHSHGHFAIWIYLYRLLLKRFFPWAKELQVPMVVHYHRVAKARWETMKKEGQTIMAHSQLISWPLEVLSDQLSMKAAAACIFVSEDNKKEAIKYHNVDPEKCFVITSGVNPEMFKPASAEEKEKSRVELELDIYDKVVLYSGNLVERKNVLKLVDAMQYLPHHYRLILVGSGDGAYIQQISESIVKKKLEDQVIRAGYTPYPQIPIAFQISDVFVLPSTWEGSPKVVIEALSTGVPCLVSGFRFSEDVPGLEYLESTEPDYLAKRIQETVENPPEVNVSKIIRAFAWENKAMEIERVYDYAKKNFI